MNTCAGQKRFFPFRRLWYGCLACVLLVLQMSMFVHAYAIEHTIDFSRLPLTPDEEAVSAGRSNELWDTYSPAAKSAAIKEAIERFGREQRIVIRKSPDYYVKAIDTLRAKDPSTRQYHIGTLFRTLAVIEYDFDEGIDREETLQRWMGGYYDDFKRSQLTGYTWCRSTKQERERVIGAYVQEHGLPFAVDDVLAMVNFFYNEGDGAYRYLGVYGVLNMVVTCERSAENAAAASSPSPAKR